MRRVVIAKLLGVILLGLYLAIGLTRPPATETPARSTSHTGHPQPYTTCSAPGLHVHAGKLL
jgi:hypothetical protein